MARGAAAVARRTKPSSRAQAARRTPAKAAPDSPPTRRTRASRNAPARRAPAPGHAARRRTTSQRGAAAHRRVSGASAAAPALALPVRVLNAPFARAARARTGSVLDALLSGRGWIALVFVLLAGIVFFNVDLLQMNRDIARNADRISALKRENARLILDEARLASSERIQEAAAQLGFVLPAPGEIRYLKARPTRDAGQAVKRITAPNLTYVAPEPVEPEPVAPTIDPAVTDPAAADPAVTDPAATTDPATTTDPAATAPADPAATAEPAPTTATAPAG
jgi:cell division protein FtsL